MFDEGDTRSNFVVKHCLIKQSLTVCHRLYNNQQQLTRLCSFQEYFVLLQSPPRNNGNQRQHAVILVRVQCHDAMITKEINLFGLARVEDECKTQTRFIEFVIIPSWHWTRTRTYFSLPLKFRFCRNKQIIRKHAMKLTLITFKDECEYSRRFSQQYANHC